MTFVWNGLVQQRIKKIKPKENDRIDDRYRKRKAKIGTENAEAPIKRSPDS